MRWVPVGPARGGWRIAEGSWGRREDAFRRGGGESGDDERVPPCLLACVGPRLRAGMSWPSPSADQAVDVPGGWPGADITPTHRRTPYRGGPSVCVRAPSRTDDRVTRPSVWVTMGRANAVFMPSHR